MIETSEQPPTHKRPRWLIVIALTLAIYQGLAAINGLQQPGVLGIDLGQVGLLQVVTGVVWAVLFLTAAYRLFSHARRARQFFYVLLIAFVVYSLLRLILFAEADYDRQRLPFLILLTAFVCSIPLWRLLHPGEG